MKKSLFVLGVAVVALASCTNEEVTEVAQNRVIGFNSFVNNNTKAVTEVNSLANSEFYVFGMYDADQTTWGKTVFSNELGSTVHYWEPSSYYRFGAYADGAAGDLATATAVSFAAGTGTNGTLTFTSYTPDDAKDLVAAVASASTGADVSSQDAVSLNFKHMLSQVAFEFTTDAADHYTLVISNVKINNAVSKATGTYDGSVSWPTPEESKGYTYEDFAVDKNVDIANSAQNYTASQTKLVIPQDGTDALTVTFTATLSDTNYPSNPTKTKNFTGYLSFSGTDKNDPEISLAENTWTPGYRYKYTTKITADMIDDELKDKEIEFTTSVDSWKDATDTTITPSAN